MGGFPLTRTRSPLREVPLRVAGQATEQEMAYFVRDEDVTFVSPAAFLLALPAYEVVRWFVKPPPSPWLFTVRAVLVFAYSMYRLARFKTRLKTLKLGRDGESACAGGLEEMRSEG